MKPHAEGTLVDAAAGRRSNPRVSQDWGFRSSWNPEAGRPASKVLQHALCGAADGAGLRGPLPRGLGWDSLQCWLRPGPRLGNSRGS